MSSIEGIEVKNGGFRWGGGANAVAEGKRRHSRIKPTEGRGGAASTWIAILIEGSFDTHVHRHGLPRRDFEVHLLNFGQADWEARPPSLAPAFFLIDAMAMSKIEYQLTPAENGFFLESASDFYDGFRTSHLFALSLIETLCPSDHPATLLLRGRPALPHSPEGPCTPTRTSLQPWASAMKISSWSWRLAPAEDNSQTSVTGLAIMALGK